MESMPPDAGIIAAEAAPPSQDGPLGLEEVREDTLQVDLGNLLAFNPRQLSAAAFATPADTDKTCMELGRMVMQALAARLFSLPSTPDKAGRLIKLPPPTTALPREKPLPKPRPPTKWEKFAQTKGITKRKRSKLEFDEEAGDWRRRFGYKRVHDERDEIIMEAKPGDEVGVDPFAAKKSEKRERVAKQEKRQLQNLKLAAKAGGKAALPSTVQLAATALPIFGNKESRPKMGKEQIGRAASMASTATASIGKFDQKRPDEKPLKQTGKHRKFLPVVDGKGSNGRERQQMQSILNKVIAKNDHDIIDVGKAVSVYTKAEEGKRAEANRSGKKEKTAKKRKGSGGANGDVSRTPGGKKAKKGKR